MIQISIPKPCHENWETMQPGEHGRHCSACATTVIDFTSMDDETVRQYLINNKKKTTCGRFRNEQLSLPIIQLPENILQLQLPKWKRFLTACLFAFSSLLFSCETRITMGETVPIDSKDSSAELHQPGDEPVVVGNFYHVDTSTMEQRLVNKITAPMIVEQVEMYTTGVLFYEPVPAQQDSTVLPGKDLINNQDNCTDTTVREKNPPAADSIHCDSIKYY